MYDGDLSLIIDNPLMMKGVDRDCPIVIDAEDKITALAEPYDIQHILAYTLRSLKSMIGEISNYATAYHNRVPSSEMSKGKYESYVELLSISNGKAIQESNRWQYVVICI